MIDTVSALQAVPLLQGLTRVELAKLLPELEDRHFEPNETLFLRGDNGDALYVIRAGRVEIEVEGELGADVVRIALLGPGDTLGEFSLLTGEPRNATARAVEPVATWRLAKERFDYLVNNNAQVASFLTRLLVRRLMATNADLVQARDQLAKQVADRLDALPAAVKEFAARVCVLDRIYPERVKRLPGCADAEACLAALGEAGLAQQVTASGAWRMSDYVREVLAARLAQQHGPDAVDQARRAIAVEYERLGESGTAIDLYVAAQAYDDAKRLFAPSVARFARHDPLLAVTWAGKLIDNGWQPPGHDLERLAIAATAVDDSSAALRFYQLAVDSVDIGEDSEHKSRIYGAIADVYLKRGETEQAITYLRLSADQVDTATPGTASQFHDSMVGQLLQRGRRDEAVGWARKALLSRRTGRETGLLAHWAGPHTSQWLGGLTAVVVTVGLALAPHPEAFSDTAWRTLALLLGAAILWLFNTMPDFVVALILVVLCIVFGATDSGTAMAGFSSQTYFITLGVLALGAGMLRTGVTYRFSLHMLQRFPPYYTWQVVGLALAGFFMTPVIPLVMGRLAIAAPLALTISDALRLGDRSKGSAGLAMAVFLGFSSMFFWFFNGPGALFIVGLLPPAAAKDLDFLTWFLWSMPFGLVLFVGSVIGILMLYPAKASGAISPQTIRQQLELLGPVTTQERVMLAIVAVALVWFTQEPWGINPAWIMLLSVTVMIIGGVFDRNTLRNSIDWPQLINLGAMLGFASIASKSGLNAGLAAVLSPVMAPFTGNAYTFLTALIVCIYLLRIALPGGPVFILMLLSFLPLAAEIGMHPFVIAQVVNVGINVWLFPQQSIGYQSLHSATEERAFTHPMARPFALLHMGLTLAGILISVPFWQAAGLIK